MATTMIALDEDTERRPVVRATEPAKSVRIIDAPELRFPTFYIVAPARATLVGLVTLVVRRIETVTAEVFVAWVRSVLAAEGRTLLVPMEYSHITVATKFKAINALAKSNIDMTKYLFDSHDAAKTALDAMKSAKSGESEAHDEPL